MPIRKFDRMKDERGLYTAQRHCIVECDQCGRQADFTTGGTFTDITHPPEVEAHGFTTILKPHGYDFICEEHIK